MVREFVAHECVHKKIVREKLFYLFRKRNTIFSLPSSNFILEERLMKAGKQLYTVESNKQIYVDGLVKMQNLGYNVNHYNTTVLEYFLTNDISFDGMYLDYCGPLTSTNILNSSFALKHLKSKGIVAHTFMFAREHYEGKVLIKRYSASSGDNHDVRISGIINFMEHHWELETFDTYFYIRNSTPMCTFFSIKK